MLQFCSIPLLVYSRGESVLAIVLCNPSTELYLQGARKLCFSLINKHVRGNIHIPLK